MKVNPWSDAAQLMKTKPVALLSAHERMPFAVTPLFPYLTRLPSSRPAGERGRVKRWRCVPGRHHGQGAVPRDGIPGHAQTARHAARASWRGVAVQRGAMTALEPSYVSARDCFRWSPLLSNWAERPNRQRLV